MKSKIFFLLLSLIGYSQIPTYYSSIDFTQSGNTLKAQLSTLITTTHTNQLPYTSTATDVWDALQSGDKNPLNSSQVLLIYGYNDVDAIFKNDRIDAVTNICSTTCPAGSWNREHCYALSLGTPALVTSSPGPGTDAHHIRASDVTFNADRGNRLYADGEGDAGPVGIYWYPGDEWKGDIARMMMYMYVRYNTRCLAVNVGSGATTYNADMPDIFLEWNEEDPVGDFERTRNNVLESIQGNRNPFIDNPYLATLIWGGPQAPDTWNTLSCPNTTIWDGFSWSNGVPDKGVKAIISGNFTSSGDLNACSLSITGSSQVILQSNHTFTIVRNLNVDPTASFTIQNNANLVQINHVSNSGNITLMRESAPILRLDYTAWSAPVSNQNLLAFSPNTLSNRFYEYISSGTTPSTAYISINPSLNNFLATKGYVIRSPNNWSSSISSPYFGTFVGIPNNGEYFSPINLGYNLLGNPYPATIQASHFIGLNRTIETLYFWTHTSQAIGGLYPMNNFASYTNLGGVAAAAGGQIPDGTIKPGQGFYLYSSENTTAWFHNALRYDVKNSQFFRNELAENKDVFRINLNGDNKAYNQILIGYTNKASNNFDLGIDGKAFEIGIPMIYTLIDDEKYVIQGRPTFDEDDSVILGFKSETSGFFSISLENFEGVFSSKPIYLKDKLTNSLIDLKDNSYSFLSEPGIFNDRFEIVYKRPTLIENSLEDVIVYTTDNEIAIFSNGNSIDKVEVYDVLGRELLVRGSILSERVSINNIRKSNQALILVITLNNGNKINKKVVF